MTRGRPATTGIGGAAAIARARGEFIPFGHTPEGVFSLMIRGPVVTTFVRVQYVTVLHAPVAAICGEHRDLIAELRVRSGPAPAELWLYNKHGSYRCFRITEGGIVELDSSGNVAVLAAPGTGIVREAAGAKAEQMP